MFRTYNYINLACMIDQHRQKLPSSAHILRQKKASKPCSMRLMHQRRVPNLRVRVTFSARCGSATSPANKLLQRFCPTSYASPLYRILELTAPHVDIPVHTML